LDYIIRPDIRRQAILHREHHGVQGRQGCARNAILCRPIRGPGVARSMGRTDGQIIPASERAAVIQPPVRPTRFQREFLSRGTERISRAAQSAIRESGVRTDSDISGYRAVDFGESENCAADTNSATGAKRDTPVALHRGTVNKRAVFGRLVTGDPVYSDRLEGLSRCLVLRLAQTAPGSLAAELQNRRFSEMEM